MDAFRKYSPLAGRILIALPLINFGIYKLSNWNMMQQWFQFKGLPAPEFLLGAAILVEIIGGLLLIAGFKVRWTVVALVGYLVIVHFTMHNFWAVEGAERQPELENFLKGLMIIGGLLIVFANGPGAVSLDNRARKS
ncbi:MAG: DoxX family protein [Candidatus Krumholzibacteriia bacterium]